MFSYRQVYDDSIQLQKYYIRIRDDICSQLYFRSPALLLKEDRLREELMREEKEILSGVKSKSQNSTQVVNNSEKVDQKPLVKRIKFFFAQLKLIVE